MKCDELKRYSLDVDYEEQAIALPDDKGIYMDASEVDEAITELKQKLEDAKSTAYTESVDAGMRERRLRRALYKACANWAHHRVFVRIKTNEMAWENVEHKCLKKAEEYK